MAKIYCYRNATQIAIVCDKDDVEVQWKMSLKQAQALQKELDEAISKLKRYIKEQ